jgi:hypothetical protein
VDLSHHEALGAKVRREREKKFLGLEQEAPYMCSLGWDACKGMTALSTRFRNLEKRRGN